jgi:hypothetical protein
MNNDRLNTTIDSGGILCGTTKQPCFFNNEITTTQRDNFKSWTTATGLHPFIFNSTTAVMQYWNGSSWINFGSGATVNATTTVRGGVQIGTISDQINKTNLGTSGAPVVVPTVNLTQSGSIHGTNNSYQAGRIPILNASGAISTSLGGTGLINSASGALLTGAGSGAMQIISATTASGKTITSNGKTWRAVPLPVRVLDSKVGVGTLFNNGDRLEKNFYQVAISGSVLTAGDQLKIHIAGDAINTTGGNPIFRVRVGAASGTIMCVTTNAPALASPGTFLINSNITVRTLGVTGTMAGDFELTDVTSTGESSYACATIGNITVNTTGSIRFTVTAQWPNTNNTQTIYYEQASLTRFSTP